MDQNTVLIALTIDENLRTIAIPTNGVVFGVVGDVEVNRVQFVLPRYFRGFDLTEFTARVNYANPNGDANYYEADDITDTDGNCTFTWLMGSDVTAYVGDVTFSITLYKKEGDIVAHRFGTRTATGRILEGYSVEESVTPAQQKTLVEKISEEVISNFKTDDVVAQVEKNKEDVNSLKEDLVNYGIGTNALPKRSSSYISNGITYTLQADGHTIEVSGTAKTGSHFNWNQSGIPSWISTEKKYIAKVLNGNEKVQLVIYAYANEKWNLLASTTSEEKEFFIPKNTENLWIRLDVASGDSVSAMITPIIADTYSLYKQQADIAQNKADIAQNKADINYLSDTNNAFGFVEFYKGFIDYYGNESSSNTRMTCEYIDGNGIFKILNPFNVPLSWHFYDTDKKHIGTTKADYVSKSIFYIDMTDYAYFRFNSKEVSNKTNAVRVVKINPSDEIKHISNIASIAHQGYSITERFYGDSRLSSYKGAKDAGFTDAETDVTWSSDGIPVCCHDASFVDATSGETIIINEHTLDELKTYDYYGEKICKFEEILIECKKLGLILHIDHAGNFLEDSQFQILFNLVKKYKMQDFVVWSSAHEKHIRMMLNIYPNSKISRGITAEYLEANLTALKKIHDDFPNAKLSFSQQYTEFSDSYSIDYLISKIPAYIGLCIWNVNDIDIYEKYVPYVTSMSSDKISYPIYMMRKIYCEVN